MIGKSKRSLSNKEKTAKCTSDPQQLKPKSDHLAQKLAEGCLTDPRLKVFLSLVDKTCRDLHLMIHMNFPPDHPIEEMGR